jgi:superfamily II DNA or RNA helicase
MELQDKKLYIRKKNETYLEVLAVDSILFSLSDFFSFFVPGHQFMPKFRMKVWNGKLHLFNRNTCELYVGLREHIKEYARMHGYEVIYTDGDLDIEDEFSVLEAESFVNSLKLHAKRIEDKKDVFIPIQPHQYQVDALRHSIQSKRCLLLSPTASGKSLIIYMLLRYYQKIVNGKILIIVPTVNLVQQLYTDFGEYSYDDTWDVRNEIHMIYQGQEKNSDKQIIVATWQSIYNMPLDYFAQFDVVIGDECHGFKANSLKGIMEKSYLAQYRFGTTGTLDDTKIHKLVLEGLFGKVYKVTTSDKLIQSKILSDIQINCLMLYYPEPICKIMKDAKYHDEVSYLVEHKIRNKFIRNLALSLKGNTLVLFQFVAKHGDILYEDIKNKAGDGRKVFFISGKIETEIREQIRKITEKETDAIIVASFGTYSVGVNIRNLHNIIFASPAKSRIRVLQSLGRGMRKGDVKDKLNLYDISDVLQYKSHQNYTLKHFLKRMEIYNSEKFSYKIFKVKLKDA